MLSHVQELIASCMFLDVFSWMMSCISWQTAAICTGLLSTTFNAQMNMPSLISSPAARTCGTNSTSKQSTGKALS